MTTDHNPNFSERKTDPDIDEQALPGHGVPSQDPDPNAQLGMSPSETRREKSSTFVIGGALVGLAAGAVIGAAVSGPMGVLVGATLGSIAGALGGSAAGLSNASATFYLEGAVDSSIKKK